MLLPLTQQQISDNWELLAPALEAALEGFQPPTHRQMNNLLLGLLNNEYTCWAAYENEEDGAMPIALVLTVFTYDMIYETKSLVVYALTTFKPYSRGLMRAAWETLKLFAIDRGCTDVSAIAVNEKAAGIPKLLGAEKQFLFWRKQI